MSDSTQHESTRPQPEEPVGRRSRLRRLRASIVMICLSVAFHIALLLLLASLIFLPNRFNERINAILVVPGDGETTVEPLEIVPMPKSLADRQVDSLNTSVPTKLELPEESLTVLAEPAETLIAADPVFAMPKSVPRYNAMTSGRTRAGRTRLVKMFGGSAASEKAVNRGLNWLARIQLPDGSWSFRKIGKAQGAGTVSKGTKMGATACALLCFLGAGHTHKDPGPYQQVVARGFHFLLQEGEAARGAGYDFRGPVPDGSNAGMYIQGMVTLALAEGFGMTRDHKLYVAAENGCDFIIAAQDPRKGGWRYKLGRGSDTSVTGWQMMALMSAQRGKIDIPRRTFALISRFLASVAADNGARYGYTTNNNLRPSTTAVGLLCQMYLGWDHDRPALKRGVQYLMKLGPNFNDFYYTYYATYVLHNWGRDPWKTWNKKVRDGLVARQIKVGPAKGSWNPTGSISGRSGGRLFDTFLAIMTLEVYYRYLPLYKKRDVAFEF